MIRTVECYDIGEDEEDESIPDNLSRWYENEEREGKSLGTTTAKVRTLRTSLRERDPNEAIEVVLDSGADCRVLPLEFYSASLTPRTQVDDIRCSGECHPYNGGPR